VREFSDQLKTIFVKDLLAFSEESLTTKYGMDIGKWLYNIPRGIDNDTVLSKGMVNVVYKLLRCT